MDIAAIAHGVAIWALPVIVAITFHEAAHGFVAWRLGDDTAKRLGRVTINPISHIDMMGTIVIPGILLLVGAPPFGWAKPVPVNFARLRNPRRDMIWVAAAGPATNLVLAIVAMSCLRPSAQLPLAGDWLQANLGSAIMINLVLAVFNMLPLPPLDGGRVAVGLLPRALALPLAQLERFGLFIIIGVLFILPMIGRQLGVPLDILPWLIGGPVEFLLQIIAWMAG